jgi:branched-subunit amino acid transport protein
MSAWVVVVAVGVGSFAFRAVPLFVGGRLAARPGLERRLEHAMPAVLAAMVVLSVQRQGPFGATATTAASAVALTVGAVLAARGRSLLVTVAGGLTAHWLVLLAVALA